MKKIIYSLVTSSLLFGGVMYAKDSYGDVNGQSITKEDISIFLRNPSVNFDTLPQKTKDDVLAQLADRMLLAQEALKSDVVNSAEFKTTLERIKSDLAFQLWAQNIAKSITIDDKQAQDFLNKNKPQFENFTSFKARHILVKTEDEAKKVIAELKKSKKAYEDFIKIAKEKTQDPSGKTTGGDLPWFEADKMVPEFSKATSELTVGTFSQTPVKTDYGYHIIYLEDKKAVELNVVKQVMLNELASAKIKNLLIELKKTAKITIAK